MDQRDAEIIYEWTHNDARFVLWYRVVNEQKVWALTWNELEFDSRVKAIRAASPPLEMKLGVSLRKIFHNTDGFKMSYLI